MPTSAVSTVYISNSLTGKEMPKLKRAEFSFHHVCGQHSNVGVDEDVSALNPCFQLIIECYT